jgi:hypothetical protein
MSFVLPLIFDDYGAVFERPFGEPRRTHHFDAGLRLTFLRFLECLLALRVLGVIAQVNLFHLPQDLSGRLASYSWHY